MFLQMFSMNEVNHETLFWKTKSLDLIQVVLNALKMLHLSYMLIKFTYLLLSLFVDLTNACQKPICIQFFNKILEEIAFSVSFLSFTDYIFIRPDWTHDPSSFYLSNFKKIDQLFNQESSMYAGTRVLDCFWGWRYLPLSSVWKMALLWRGTPIFITFIKVP